MIDTHSHFNALLAEKEAHARDRAAPGGNSTFSVNVGWRTGTFLPTLVGGRAQAIASVYRMR